MHENVNSNKASEKNKHYLKETDVTLLVCFKCLLWLNKLWLFWEYVCPIEHLENIGYSFNNPFIFPSLILTNVFLPLPPYKQTCPSLKAFDATFQSHLRVLILFVVAEVQMFLEFSYFLPTIEDDCSYNIVL